MELIIANRNYTKWSLNPENPSLKINPLNAKLFSGDIINSEGVAIHSPYRNNVNIPGVLILDGKTYGRVNDIGKLLYKCIPNDPTLPCFLIPYEDKIFQFAKKKTNKYIAFKIMSWLDKHPIGQLTNSFGEVTEPENYYQYQLCCKNLQKSLVSFNSFIQLKLKFLANTEITAKFLDKVEDRRTAHIFSIDPIGCKDVDDAIGFKIIDTHNSIISIYIANVALILDYLCAWNVFSERVATIYLPNGKIPMLPPSLADDLCSLLAGKDRYAFCLDIHINETAAGIVVTNCEFKAVLINVKKNYYYEEASLLHDKDYVKLLHLTKLINKEYKYIDDINESHVFIEFYMIFMNYESSKRLLQKKTGIFRSAHKVEPVEAMPEKLSKDIKQFLKSYNTTNCKYCTSDQAQAHDLIGAGLNSYVHITSPIRRLVDLINLIEIHGEIMSEGARMFSTVWLTRIDYINKTMKAIRKVQNNCSLLHMYMHTNRGECYTGVIFNKTRDININKFSVYIPALKMVSTIKTDMDLSNYQMVVVSGHLFTDEDNIMKKIRLQIV